MLMLTLKECDPETPLHQTERDVSMDIHAFDSSGMPICIVVVVATARLGKAKLGIEAPKGIRIERNTVREKRLAIERELRQESRK